MSSYYVWKSSGSEKPSKHEKIANARKKAIAIARKQRIAILSRSPTNPYDDMIGLVTLLDKDNSLVYVDYRQSSKGIGYQYDLRSDGSIKNPKKVRIGRD